MLTFNIKSKIVVKPPDLSLGGLGALRGDSVCVTLSMANGTPK